MLLGNDDSCCLIELLSNLLAPCKVGREQALIYQRTSHSIQSSNATSGHPPPLVTLHEPAEQPCRVFPSVLMKYTTCLWLWTCHESLHLNLVLCLSGQSTPWESQQRECSVTCTWPSMVVGVTCFIVHSRICTVHKGTPVVLRRSIPDHMERKYRSW